MTATLKSVCEYCAVRLMPGQVLVVRANADGLGMWFPEMKHGFLAACPLAGAAAACVAGLLILAGVLGRGDYK